MRYLHESKEISKHIEPENEKSDSPKLIRFYARVDIEVAAALISTVVEYKNKPPIDQVRIAMLKAASKRMQEIKCCSSKPLPHPKIFGITWFGANDLLDQTAVAATSDETKAKVAVLEFDETTGKRLNQQVSFEKAIARATAPIDVPWKCWHNENLDVAETAADKAAIVAMLENIHRRWDVSAVQVQMMMTSALSDRYIYR